MHIRCPNCQEWIEIQADCVLTDVVCGACHNPYSLTDAQQAFPDNDLDAELLEFLEKSSVEDSGKCEHCDEAATLHVSEKSAGNTREFHFCEAHAQQYLHGGDVPAVRDVDQEEGWECARCGAQEFILLGVEFMFSEDELQKSSNGKVLPGVACANCSGMVMRRR